MLTYFFTILSQAYSYFLTYVVTVYFCHFPYFYVLYIYTYQTLWNILSVLKGLIYRYPDGVIQIAYY